MQRINKHLAVYIVYLHKVESSKWKAKIITGNVLGHWMIAWRLLSKFVSRIF